jgi:hypothetical protein
MPPANKKVIDIKLRKLNLNWIGDNKVIILIGARGFGKSTVLLDYLYHNQDIPFACCIAPTDVYNHTFTPHIPSRFIFSKYTPELISSFIKRQQSITAKKQIAQGSFGYSSKYDAYKDVDTRGILIMDDCLASNSQWKKDENIRWIFLNGRHNHVTFILTMQYQLGIPPDLRYNIDWVFLCMDKIKESRQKLYKYYAGIFHSCKMFEQIFMSCTSDHRCMVIDKSKKSANIEEQVFWYKAKIRNEFKICYDEFWAKNDYYLKKRLSAIGITDDDEDVTKKQDPVEDYYKYTDRNAVFKLNVEEEEKPVSDERYAKYSGSAYPISY